MMKVEIWSDIACPWCYIGKRRFETALESFDDDVEIEWRSFELDPGAPKEVDGPLSLHLARKYRVSQERADQMLDNMTETAAAEGLEFDFDNIQSGNTFDAHRLLHFAREEEKGAEMKERLLRAYFVEGRSVSDTDELVSLASDVGLDADAARAALASDAFADDVRQEEQRAREIGIHGVPFFLVGGEYGVSGAQTPDTFLHVLQRAKRDLMPDEAPEGVVCDDDGCRVEPGE